MKARETKKSKFLSNDKGLTMIETLPLIVVFVLLLSYALGLWGAVHSGILNSIAARNYAFETFRNRSDLTYFRENGSALSGDYYYYANTGFRYHAIRSETASNSSSVFDVTQRSLNLGQLFTPQVQRAPSSLHNNEIHKFDINERAKTSTNSIWIMVGYGMCLNPTCGGRPNE